VSGDLYAGPIKELLLHRIRGEHRLATIDVLVDQLHRLVWTVADRLEGHG
jgi:hypothetical protein